MMFYAIALAATSVSERKGTYGPLSLVTLEGFALNTYVVDQATQIPLCSSNGRLEPEMVTEKRAPCTMELLFKVPYLPHLMLT